jgi:curved DNA-binding protein CbpA
MKDYYQILEVHPQASPEVITKAYRTLAMKFHPDRFHASRAKQPDHAADRHIREINEAYAILGDPLQRARYDKRYASFQKIAPRIGKQQQRREEIRNILFWAAVLIFLFVMMRSVAQVFLLTPMGKAILLVLALWLGIRWFTRERRSA